jgi:hypothetical protein
VTEKTDQVTMSSYHSDAENVPLGQFALGFSVGVIAGAVGYYLFGTEQGKQVTAELKEEWEALTKPIKNDELTAAGEPVVLPTWWVELKKTIKNIAGEVPKPKAEKAKPSKPKAVPRKHSTMPKKNTFKGI